ncbi:putative GNAT family N-acyltransferase [Enterococcus sp. PF1-24]|uniref:GNAT family N-acetyltransferase n=1 Tax=unclassified Enterococcus TaxID=2608891 RepID=UPI002473033A|nr:MULTISPECIES: GNAT family N-acetyltransferase [unclassified Enterococcus]MDH6364042.1 putative GNAT family N-acyltransferase [Enterococcus sp. PFB1-1]MDH6401143.1 putative GNAT family N-acyltransferase [Enterococcus sp. PF1-24]
MKTIWSKQKEIQAAAYYLRYQVFVIEQGISPNAEFDAYDTSETIYGVGFIDNMPVATIRYQQISTTTLQPDRFCVLAAYRKQGFGKQLLLALEELAKENHCQEAILSAETSALNFYQKLGYHVISEVFLEDGIACMKMQKKLG